MSVEIAEKVASMVISELVSFDLDGEQIQYTHMSISLHN